MSLSKLGWVSPPKSEEEEVDSDLEVLTNAAEVFDSLLAVGVKLDGNYGNKLRKARENLTRRFVEGDVLLRKKDEALQTLLKEYELEVNKKGWAEDPPYRCKTCGTICKTRDTFRKHLKSHDPRNFVCPSCPNKFFTERDLANHLIVHRPEKPFRCPQCPVHFKRKSDVQKHLRIKHSERKSVPDEKRTECPLCGRNFVQSQHCRRHQRTCHGLERASLSSPKKAPNPTLQAGKE